MLAPVSSRTLKTLLRAKPTISALPDTRIRCYHARALVESADKKNQERTFTSINQDTPYNLVILRHGQSTWNRDNRFIGWTDTPLTDDGVLEARVAGQMLSNSGILFDEVHTSMLRRSIRTVNLVLMEMGQEYIPVHKHWRLNERYVDGYLSQ